MHRRFLMCMGWPASHFAPDARDADRRSWVAVALHTEEMLCISEMSIHLQEYLRKNDCAEKFLANIWKETNRGRRNTTRYHTRLERLQRLKEWFPTVLPKMDVDYMKCTSLVSKIREALK